MRKDKEIKNKNNLILRKMCNAGYELTNPGSRGRCSNHCAMEDLNFRRLYFLFIDSR